MEASDANNNTARLAVTVTVTNVTDLGTPSNLQVTQHESGQLRAFWSAPDSGTPPTGYTVQWKKSEADWADEEDVSEEPVTATSHIIKGLTDGEEYDVRVIASKDDTDSAPSQEASATPQEITPPTPNSPATGAPTISGTAQVCETLTADVSGIADSDGLANVTFAYQWIADDADIAGATASTYTPVAADEGKDIKVRVSFTDDAGHAETLTSAATDAVAATPNSAATGAPTITGTVQVGETLTVGTSGIADSDGLTNVTFSYQWLADDAAIAGATASTYTLVAADEDKAIKVRVSFTDDAGHAETLTSAATDAVAATPSSPATGQPTISGMARVGETLTVGTSGIADSDGLTNVTFAYQWIADDSDIAGATGSTYTLVAADEGKAIKVRVSFTDDASHAESLTSAATAGVAATPNSAATGAPTITGTVQVGETLTAGTSGMADSDGLTNVTFAYQWIADDADIAGATASTYTPVAADEGKAIKVRVSFTDDAGHAETLTSAATDAVAATPNSAATGKPAISGTAQVGETLTADVSGIAEADGLGNATFSYQWVRVDGQTEADISSAVAPAYHPTTDDVGKTVKVRVRFTDDAGHFEGPLVSGVTDSVKDSASVHVPWTATLTTAAATVDPANLESGDPEKIGYGDASAYPESSLVPATFVVGSTTYTVREVAVDTADLLIHIAPQLSAADVANWRFLVRATEFTPGTPVNESELDYSLLRWGDADLDWNAGDRVALALRVVNTAATGQPTISGTAQVGETLTAATAAIADADGLGNVAFTYQWLADDTDIEGATGSSYTLAAADEGKAIKVRVSFTDLAGFSEGPLTSAATATVAAKPNNPATGQPTISGTVQVGEELTASTAAIADADGLDNVTYSYQWLADDTAIEGATSSTCSLTDDEEGKAIKVRVSFTDDAGNQETLTSAATAAVAAKPNSPATGQPTISGTAQVGEELTASTAAIADADGLDNVTYGYQWLADDTAIEGATSSTYSLTDDEEGKAIKVRVSFTDDAGNQETLTSAATAAVEPA